VGHGGSRPGRRDFPSDLLPTRRIGRPPDSNGPTAVVLVPPVEEVEATPPPAAAGPPFPKTGDRFLHFELVEEIGRGSFARVFLARQEALANRLVVLKFTPEPTDEPQKLARLQHPNIVPVYSVHGADTLQAVCMPYLGRVTLARLMSHLEGNATGRHGSGRDLLSTLIEAGRTTPRTPQDGGVAPPADTPTADTLAAVAHLSFVDAALWLAAQLAGGLAHAHSRGVLHRDLKPANVLVTDDGVPMILDFNVSADSARRGSNGPIGGTMPYMAPEHVRAFAGRADRVGEQSDLYSLGVILYELLTGRPLFRSPRPHLTPAELMGLIAERHAPPLPPSRLNPAVSAAVDAITLKLLDPDPARRYARADDLREDLTRQLAHRPLKFAPDRYIPERVGKWRKRHPRLATGLAVAAAAMLLVVAPTAAVAHHEWEKKRHTEQALAAAEAERQEAEARAAAAKRAEAQVAYKRAVSDLQAAAMLLGSRTDPALPGQGLTLGREVLERYGMTDDQSWESGWKVASLEPKERADLKARLAEVLVLMTRIESVNGGFRPESLAAAERWNRLAAAFFPADRTPAVLGRQRAELDARRAGLPVPVLPVVRPEAATDTDLYFDGLEFAAAGQPGEALPRLVRFGERHPDRFLVWFARGIAHHNLGQHADATAAFAACVALSPDVPHAHLNRGLARLRLRQYPEAEADFTKVLDLGPGGAVVRLAYHNRGLAREGRRHYPEAEADLTAALAEPDAPTRYYFARYRVREKLGKHDAARADRSEGLRREPTDADSWTARGYQRLLERDATGALADFDTALRINPTSRDALLNRAIVFADHLDRNEDAVVAFTRLLEHYPDHIEACGGRAVSLARLGRADEAVRDAKACLKEDRSPFRLYQMAGVYALISKSDPKARDEAFRLLGQALQSGYNDWKTMDSDSDVELIRKDPRFAALTAAAKRLETGGK
jgi:serine/threonine protein kinase/lipoprotein NlpI